MLDFYIESDSKRRQLRQCPGGEHVDGFAGWLHAAGYRRRPAQLALRAAAHLGYWAAARGIPTERFDEQLLDAFACHLASCTCSHAFRGHDDYHTGGARRFAAYLHTIGILAKHATEAEALAPLVKGFSDWMRQHRGIAQSTLTNYMPLVAEFVAALGDDATTYDAGAVRAFIFARASTHGCGHAKSVANAVRMFLRFLAAYGHCSAELIAAVPRIAHWKLASLPRYISAAAIDQLIAACDPTTAGGARDRAIILLLAQLGLRAGDVRDLRLADIDWPHGRLRVVGKGRCETWLPLPQAAGDALLHYLTHFRQGIDDDHVFLRVHAPLGPLPSSGPISKLVRRTIQRAGIQTPSLGAHMLRHSAATEMLRQGCSLDIIGAVLRHRCIESTAHYAKVDVATLRSVAQPWPANGGSPC